MHVITPKTNTMKKTLLFLFFAFCFVYEINAQFYEDMIVLRDDLDSCEIIRPSVMPEFSTTQLSQLYYTIHHTTVLSYPEEAIKNHIRGNVIYSFRMTKDCKVTDFKLVKGLGYGMDEIALNFSHLINNPTEAAEYQGEKVDLLCVIVVHFHNDPNWPIKTAKNFSMEKYLDENAVLIGANQDSIKRPWVSDVSEIDYECRVPYVRFTVKARRGKIAKVKVVHSSGFESLDKEAEMALWNLEYWKGGQMEKNVEYIVPVKFDANIELGE